MLFIRMSYQVHMSLLKRECDLSSIVLVGMCRTFSVSNC
ncbi:hypothetical protein THF5H11_10614 [Vibrio jasicida]|uniref:Uncharacterized protein n=1 Tax=Vibrio jasicida TaxID=766224 RepID=A0AAU9QW66_9VIBR|nr:hypothetical protein THF5H11_10614 [Vibrio jasicida]CAH1602172.1 hypothetical protein THF1C08_80045 [Vibrio jasicida]CAH1603324.1 hypothetical protein THF1A12_70043 [Vibrio jasicida]CAH1609293.1 hypothetical protein THF5G08_90027 [Vibrio jasicida]